MTNSTSKEVKVKVDSVELNKLKALAELGKFVENLCLVADVQRTRQNIHKILTMHLLLDHHQIPDVDEAEDILILCEFLDQIAFSVIEE